MALHIVLGVHSGSRLIMRALSGRLKFTFRHHNFNKDSLPIMRQPKTGPARAVYHQLLTFDALPYMYLKEALVGLALVIHLCPGRALSTVEAHSSLANRKMPNRATSSRVAPIVDRQRVASKAGLHPMQDVLESLRIDMHFCTWGLRRTSP